MTPRSDMQKYPLVLGTATVVVIIDQITKWYIRNTMYHGESIPVFDAFFAIVHAQNPGGAFGMFADGDSSWRLPFFLIVSVVAVGILVSFVQRVKPQYRLLLVGLGGILGGAIGNFIDRAAFGTVTDFLDVYWNDWHWPAFNVADSGISLGMVVMVFYSLFGGDDVWEEDPDPEESSVPSAS